MRSRRKLFTEEEDLFLRKNYHVLDQGTIATRLGRCKASIRSRAQKLGVATKIGPRHKRPANFVSTVSKPLACTEASACAEPEREAFPVSEAARKLAAFDPIVKRCVAEREWGLPPGKLRNGALAGHE